MFAGKELAQKVQRRLELACRQLPCLRASCDLCDCSRGAMRDSSRGAMRDRSHDARGITYATAPAELCVHADKVADDSRGAMRDRGVAKAAGTGCCPVCVHRVA